MQRMAPEPAASGEGPIPQPRPVVASWTGRCGGDRAGPSMPVQQDGSLRGEGRETSGATTGPLFLLKPELLKALSSVGALAKPYTFKEVLGLLKAFLYLNRSLIDINDPTYINCGNTPLGLAFGVEKFQYREVRYLLSLNVTYFAPTLTNIKPNNSSSGQCSSHGTISHSIKIFLPEIPESQSGSESDYSVQGYETALCEDSDDERILSASEYELVTEAEVSVDEGNDSDSDAESLILILGLEEDKEEEEDFFADRSDSSTDSESENSTEDEHDQWPCLTCGIKNKPFMRYCLKCWELRKDWFPDPPKRRRKRKSRPKKDRKFCSRKAAMPAGDSLRLLEDDSALGSLPRMNSGASTSTVTSCSSSVSSAVASSSSSSSQDSGFGSQPEASALPPLPEATPHPERVLGVLSGRKRKFSNETPPAEEESKDKSRRLSADAAEETQSLTKKARKFMSTSAGARWLLSSKALKEELSRISSESEEDLSNEGTCSLCYARPKNASIIHGRISHIGFCYPCAKRLYNAKAKCPICRRKIHMITKNKYV